MMTVTRPPMILIVVIVLAVAGHSSSGSDAKPRVRERPLAADDLGSRYRILGKLGIPIGRVTVVRGAWVTASSASEKYGQEFLRITEVGDVKLRNDVVYHARDVRLRSEEQQPRTGIAEYRVYETARYWGTPPGAGELSGIQYGAGMIPWSFASQLEEVAEETTNLTAASDTWKGETLTYESIVKEHSIRGRLGMELGFFAWVTGTWKRSDEGTDRKRSLMFCVTAVNDVILREAVSFKEDEVDPIRAIPEGASPIAVDGLTCRLRVHEWIGFARMGDHRQAGVPAGHRSAQEGLTLVHLLRYNPLNAETIRR